MDKQDFGISVVLTIAQLLTLSAVITSIVSLILTSSLIELLISIALVITNSILHAMGILAICAILED